MPWIVSFKIFLHQKSASHREPRLYRALSPMPTLQDGLAADLPSAESLSHAPLATARAAAIGARGGHFNEETTLRRKR